MIGDSKFSINGRRIIENDQMLMDGCPCQVKRSWRERLTERPWEPFKATKTIVPRIPANYSYFLPNGDVVMHPQMARNLKEYHLKVFP